MKKVILLIAILLAYGCDKDNASQSVEPQIDCNCDRVVEVNYFTMPTNPVQYYCVYFTINDCTELQKQKSITVTNQAFLPKVGECR